MTEPRSVTTWSRLEPEVRDESLTGGLEARVADPLWLLGRQWQLGEFQGEDAGSPVVAELDGEADRLVRYRPGPADADAEPYDPTTAPLEALVERERVRPAAETVTDPGARRDVNAAAQAGLHFQRLLAGEGRDHDVGEFREQLRLSRPAGDLDDESRRFADVVSGRVLDGDRLYLTLRDADAADLGASLFGSPVDDPQPYRDAAERYVEWYRNLYDEPPEGAQSAWQPDRMEYAPAVAARTDDQPGDAGEAVLAADEYAGGRLDWYDFAVADDDLGTTPEEHDARSLADSILPTAVTFPGMPAPRWWEIEDAAVDFHRLDVGASDLSRLVISEFALLYGNDWFVVPIEVPVGSLARVATVTVTDTFGEETTVEPTETVRDGEDWALFRLATDDRDPGLFVPPVLADALESETVESVVFARDEMANAAWGIERTVESPIGRALDRFEATPKPAPEAVVPTGSDVLVYELATDVPEYWYPLVPEPAGDESIRLRRGAVLDPDELTVDLPRGRILTPEGGLSLHEEELPRSGIQVTRTYQLARWTDGTIHLWGGRRKRPGAGEATSGLQFDLAREHGASE